MTCACEMGAGMLWMMLAPTLLIVGAVIAGVAVVRAIRSRTGDGEDGPSPAMSLLQERYARGEIDEDEFALKRRHLLES